MPGYNQKPSVPPRLLDQLRNCIRYKHYSLRTEKAYVFWVKRFIRFHGLRHPRTMGALEVERFLSHLATEAGVAVSTHKQALAAILFLYREVLSMDLPWLGEIGRPRTPVRIPVVLSRDEMAGLMAHMPSGFWLYAALLYGSGLRLQECLSLRVKDADLQRRVLIVRQGKGGKDRVVMLPQPAESAVRDQILRSRELWARDRSAGVPGVEMPDALARKLSRAAESLSWHWLFPAAQLASDPRTGQMRRHHQYPQTVSPGHCACSAWRTPDQTRNSAHPAPLLRHPHARFRRGHPARAGTSRAQRREYHNDLHAHTQLVGLRTEKPHGAAPGCAWAYQGDRPIALRDGPLFSDPEAWHLAL